MYIIDDYAYGLSYDCPSVTAKYPINGENGKIMKLSTTLQAQPSFLPLYDSTNVRDIITKNSWVMCDRYHKTTFVLFMLTRKTDHLLNMIIDDVMVHILRLIY